MDQHPPQVPVAKVEALNYVLTDARPGQERWWRVESNGQGWVTIGSPDGFSPMREVNSPDGFIFTEGQHSLNIGPEGYRELRRLFGNAISGKIDLAGLTNGDVRCITEKRDIPLAELGWTHPEAGSFKHPFACLSPKGDDAVARYHASWNMIAAKMAKRSQSGVLDEGAGLPGPTTPLTIDIIKRDPRTGLAVHWHLAAGGKGWVELSGGITVAIGNDMRYIAQGRHAFDLGVSAAQSVRAPFEPYISGPERLQQCPVRRTDQALVTVSWKSDAGQAGEYRERPGCAALVERERQVQQIIAARIDPK